MMTLMPLMRRLPEPIKAPLRRSLARYRQSMSGQPTESAPTDMGSAFSARRVQWDREGFVILPQLFGADQVRIGLETFERAWVQRQEVDNELVIDAFISGGVPSRMHFRDAPHSARAQVYKLNDMFLVDEEVRSLVLADDLVDAMQELVGDEVVVINSLHFERGSTQQYHIDTFYMPPPAGGQLIVSSICLEEVHPNAGPLKYYPASHLIEPFLNVDGERRARTGDELVAAMGFVDAECAARKLEPKTFLGAAGDTFLWHEQLVHGGSPIVDMSRTRRSIVTHYWTKASMVGMDIAAYGKGHYLRRNHQSVG